MTRGTNISSGNAQRPARHQKLFGEYICWSRMHTEAGQPLTTIIARKEAERRAGQGLFFWGVGNPPAIIAKVLARADVPVRVVFSIMKSRPKSEDIKPTRTVVWRRYIDMHGVNRSLPKHALITSRGDSASGSKQKHYALICRSDEPLVFRHGEIFDPSAFRNASGKGAPVGFSQVTAMLRRIAEDSGASHYEENLTAWLSESYWVRLTDPLELNYNKVSLLQEIADVAPERWLDVVADIRGGPSIDIQEISSPGSLF